MFGNFLYFIIVLLIYLTYQPSEETNFSGFKTIALFIGLIVFFFYFTAFLFRRLEKRIANGDFSQLDSLFHSILMRQSIMAILIFAIDIYGLNLSSFLIDIPLFRYDSYSCGAVVSGPVCFLPGAGLGVRLRTL